MFISRVRLGARLSVNVSENRLVDTVGTITERGSSGCSDFWTRRETSWNGTLLTRLQ